MLICKLHVVHAHMQPKINAIGMALQTKLHIKGWRSKHFHRLHVVHVEFAQLISIDHVHSLQAQGKFLTN